MFKKLMKYYYKLDDAIFMYQYDRKNRIQQKKIMLRQLELERDIEILRRIAPDVFN